MFLNKRTQYNYEKILIHSIMFVLGFYNCIIIVDLDNKGAYMSINICHNIHLCFIFQQFVFIMLITAQ